MNPAVYQQRRPMVVRNRKATPKIVAAVICSIIAVVIVSAMLPPRGGGAGGWVIGGSGIMPGIAPGIAPVITPGTAPGVTAPRPEPQPPAPAFTFEEILVRAPRAFSERGDRFSVRSRADNYLGEITISNRSYVEGSSNDIAGTYALFVTEGGNAGITATFRADGFYVATANRGRMVGNSIEYPFDRRLNVDPMLACRRDFEMNLAFNGLSRISIHWGNNQAFSDERFSMLAVAITKDEAVQYVQNGTMPRALQGLSVTGLDDIFRAPT